ncbi:MAG: hypothetical protein HY873_10325 [Chloroflexi bacterium]|nr:hypothetical protein [Chloroflexota bacterium]
MGEHCRGEVASVVASEVLEEGIEAGGDGAVVAALRAFKLEHLTQAIFSGSECGHT